MAHAYTPGLQVTDRTRYRARRILPIAGDVLVAIGDNVQARDVVARTELPGDITPVNPYVEPFVLAEAIIGVLYVAVLMARLVSLYDHSWGKGPS